MIRGLYTSGWSMMANSKKMDVISNNLANVSTNAYKKDTVIFESFPNLLTRRINDTRSSLNPSGEVGSMEFGSDVGEVFTYYNQGQLLKTDNYSDMAISGSDNAFFTVQFGDANGNTGEYYTRDGSFTVDSNGQLVTKEGYTVMGEDGPVTVMDGGFSVQADGTVVQNGEAVAKLLIKEFTDASTLSKFGSNLVQNAGTANERAFSGEVQQGCIEQSNVNIIREMVDMITVMRAYEANQKVLQAQDGTLDKAVNEVGVVR